MRWVDLGKVLGRTARAPGTAESSSTEPKKTPPVEFPRRARRTHRHPNNRSTAIGHQAIDMGDNPLARFSARFVPGARRRQALQHAHVQDQATTADGGVAARALYAGDDAARHCRCFLKLPEGQSATSRWTSGPTRTVGGRVRRCRWLHSSGPGFSSRRKPSGGHRGPGTKGCQSKACRTRGDDRGFLRWNHVIAVIFLRVIRLNKPPIWWRQSTSPTARCRLIWTLHMGINHFVTGLQVMEIGAMWFREPGSSAICTKSQKNGQPQVSRSDR